MNPVAITGLLVAAIRAEESRRPDRLFEDPHAEALAGPEGRAALARYRAASPVSVPIIEVRTRFYDEALARAAASGIRQVVILAAGMDARAYRLAWAPGTRLFEIDQPEVIAHKARVLGELAPRCERRALGQSLLDDWPAALAAAGFDARERSAWLVEGLLQYLTPAAASAVLERVDQLSAPGSVALYDIIGRRLLESPFIAPTLAMMRQLGAPWIFGSDEPAGLLPRWRAVLTDPAVIGNAWGRWPFPAAPAAARDAPRGHLVEAQLE